MIKNRIVLEVKIGEHQYEFACSPDSPLGELYDALMSMREFILQRMQEHESKKDVADDHVQPADS